MAPLTRDALWFDGPGRVRVRRESYERGGPAEAHVRTLATLVSSGTERLVLRGGVDAAAPRDERLAALGGTFAFPFKYGYCCVGELLEPCGPLAAGRRVFAFQPHHGRFVSAPEALWPLDAETSLEEALLWPSVETAVALLHDAAPLAGERVVVLGHGLIGACVTALLHDCLVSVAVLEQSAGRAALAREHGARVLADADEAQRFVGEGADLVIELTGNPAALELATRLAGREARVVVGSWYGDAGPGSTLGTSFHRKRLHLISSQVSELPSALAARWDKARRFALAQRLARRIDAGRLVTHHFALRDAEQAFALLDEPSARRLGVALTYEEV